MKTVYGHIYLISNILDERVYIGQTIQKIKDRLGWHINSLKNNNHTNTKLQRFVNKYGLETLKFEVLESNILEEDLDDVEINYIASYDSYYNGFNLTKGGNSPSLKTKKPVSIKNIFTGKIFKFESVTDCAKKLGINKTLVGQLINNKVNHITGLWCRINYDPFLYELINMNTLKNYKVFNIADFCRQLKLKYSSINKVAQGKMFEFNGWRLKCNANKIKVSNRGIKFKLINNNNKIFEFNSLLECIKKLPIGWGEHNRNLGKLINGEIQQYKGYQLYKGKNFNPDITNLDNLIANKSPITIKNIWTGQIKTFSTQTECDTILGLARGSAASLKSKRYKTVGNSWALPETNIDLTKQKNLKDYQLA